MNIDAHQLAAAAAAPAGQIVIFFLALFLLDSTVKAFVGLAYAHLTRRPMSLLLWQLAASAITFVPLAILFVTTDLLANPYARGAAEAVAIIVGALVMRWLSRGKLGFRSALALSLMATAASDLVGLLASMLG